MVKKGPRRGYPKGRGFVYFQRYHCLSVPVGSVGMSEKSRLLILKTNLVTKHRFGPSSKKFGTAVVAILEYTVEILF